MTSTDTLDEKQATTKPVYIHLRNIVNDMKQEKLCESEDMVERDYSQWYPDPQEEKRFNEELGAENTKKMWAELEKRTKHVNDEREALYSKVNKEREKMYPKVNNANSHGSDHYQKLNIQPWDAMEAWLSPEEFRGYLVGNCVKYVARAGKKGPYKDDIQKAAHYLQKLLETLE